MVSVEMLKKVMARADEIMTEEGKEKYEATKRREKKLASSIIAEAEKKLEDYHKKLENYHREGAQKGHVNNLRVYTFRDHYIYFYDKEYGKYAFSIVKKYFEEKGFAVSLKTEIASRGLTHLRDTYFRHIHLAW